MRKFKYLFVIAFIALAISPFILMPKFGFQAPESDASDVSMPTLKENGHYNLHYLKEAGDFFAKKFAFRNQLVTINSTLKSVLTHTSAQDNVIEGKDGYLFYATTLDDYEGKPTMSNRAVANAVYNLKLMQQSLAHDENGAINFRFTIAPNKNSLYPQYMPSGYKTNQETKNVTRFKKALKGSGVNYVDLYGIFNKRKEVLYQKTDSHWNNKGAALAQDRILSSLNKKHTNFTKLRYAVRHDMQGDLYKMLYPARKGTEKQIYYENSYQYKRTDDSHKNAIYTTTDDIYQTANKKKSGSLLMFRDSFGNTLVPFMADEYKNGLFLKGYRYELFQANSDDVMADDVVIELVERNLNNLALYAPVYTGQDVSGTFKTKKIHDDTATFSGTTESNYSEQMYHKLSGALNPKYAKTATTTYVHVYNKDESYIYPTYHVQEDLQGKNKDYGYGLYLDEMTVSAGTKYQVSVIYKRNGQYLETQALGSFKTQKGE